MKRIYLVRHGESEGNLGPFRQGADTPLSPTGIKQAEFVAKRFEVISIDRVIASTYQRAKHTAEIINKIINKPIEYSDLIVERKRPSVIVGKLKDDPEVLKIEALIKEHFHSPDWRYSDEESFSDLKNRALETIKYLEGCKEENILLVTHGIFSRMIASCIIMGKELTSHEYHNLSLSLTTDNTGISLLERWDESKYDHPWTIATWNDHEHIGDGEEI